MNIEKQIQNLEEALVLWSNIWGSAMTEHRFNEAEAQITKLRRKLLEVKSSIK